MLASRHPPRILKPFPRARKMTMWDLEVECFDLCRFINSRGICRLPPSTAFRTSHPSLTEMPYVPTRFSRTGCRMNGGNRQVERVGKVGVGTARHRDFEFAAEGRIERSPGSPVTCFGFGIWVFGFCFGFRYSDFVFAPLGAAYHLDITSKTPQARNGPSRLQFRFLDSPLSRSGFRSQSLLGIWSLELGAYLEFRVWSFEFRI